MQVQPYLFFEGRCEEAMEFYRKVLGAELDMMMRFSECPDKPPPGMIPPGSEKKIMHASLKIGGTTVMFSDGGCSGTKAFAGFSLCAAVATEADADRVFAALGEGGQVQMPLGPTFFSKRFGMVADQFGVSWMVIVNQPPA